MGTDLIHAFFAREETCEHDQRSGGQSYVDVWFQRLRADCGVERRRGDLA
jgi:hypothetical protein